MLLLTCIVADAFPQRHRLLDSLIALSESAPDSMLPRLYHDIAWQSRDVAPLLGVQYALMSIEAAEERGDSYCAIMASNMLAMNEQRLGNHQEALLDYKAALMQARALGNRRLEAITCTNIGNVYMQMDDLDSAQYYEDLAMACCDSLGYHEASVRIFMNKGLIAKRKGDTLMAIRNLEKSYFLWMMGDSGTVQGLPIIDALADIYMESHDYSSARDLVLQYLRDMDGSRDASVLGNVSYKMGMIYRRMGKLDSAEVMMRQSIDCGMGIGNVKLVENSCKLLDTILISRGKMREAAIELRNFISISDTVFNEALADALANIRYSSRYRENKRMLARYEQDRRDRLYFIIFAVLILAMLVWSIFRIVTTRRKAEELHSEMEHKRASILDSIRKAHSIQASILPDPDKFGISFRDGFVFYCPRDIVSGDFFWQYYDDSHEMLAVADCTGHGVPGAILTMLGASALQDIAVHGERDAARVLEFLRERVVYAMEQNDMSHMQDGMDISLIVVDRRNHTLDFAGAFNNLVYIRNGEYNLVKATRTPVSKYLRMLPFMHQKMEIMEGDVFYLCSDGFTSQFGGSDGGKYPSQRFRDLLKRLHTLPMAEQKAALEAEFAQWKGYEDQVDDVTVVGLLY